MKKVLVFVALAHYSLIAGPKFDKLVDAKDDRSQAFATLLFYEAEYPKLQLNRDKFSDDMYFIELAQNGPQKTLRAAFQKVYKGVLFTVFNDALAEMDKEKETALGKPKPGDDEYYKKYIVFLNDRYKKVVAKLPTNLRSFWGDPESKLPDSLG